MRENQNIAHCSVCSEKTHCRFSFLYIPHRLHSTESKFHSFFSPNLPNNMGDLCKILIQNGRRFITHSPTISSFDNFQFWLFSSKIFEWVPRTTTTYRLYGSCDQKIKHCFYPFIEMYKIQSICKMHFIVSFSLSTTTSQ